MRPKFLSAVSFVLAGCLSTVGGPVADERSARQERPSAAAVVATSVEKVPEVKIESFTDSTVCRNVRPTGSKIAVKRCYSRTKGDTSQQVAMDEITRRNFEEMRTQQILLEQAAFARRQAMRQQTIR